jgi:hypothetical protein
MVEGVVRIAVRAHIFGRWAVHRSVEPGDESSFVVTHVQTGRSIPSNVATGLERYQAEAIARALDEAGDLDVGLSGEQIDEWTKIAIVACVSKTLDGIASLAEVRS